MLLELPASKASSSGRGISPCAHHPYSEQLGRAGLILETSEGLPSLRLVQQAWLRDAGEQAKFPSEMLMVLRGQDAGASSLSARQGLRSTNSQFSQDEIDAEGTQVSGEHTDLGPARWRGDLGHRPAAPVQPGHSLAL